MHGQTTLKFCKYILLDSITPVKLSYIASKLLGRKLDAIIYHSKYIQLYTVHTFMVLTKHHKSCCIILLQTHKYRTLLVGSYVYWTVRHLHSWIKRDQLDVTCFIVSLFNAQHVSDINTSILKSLRLICWVISWVVLLWFDVCWCYVVVWLWWCGIRMQAEALVLII